MTKAELFKVLKDVPDDEEICIMDGDVCISRGRYKVQDSNKPPWDEIMTTLETTIDAPSLSNNEILYFSSSSCAFFRSDPTDFTRWIHGLQYDNDLDYLLLEAEAAMVAGTLTRDQQKAMTKIVWNEIGYRRRLRSPAADDPDTDA
jgi:hypothetical protein